MSLDCVTTWCSKSRPACPVPNRGAGYVIFIALCAASALGACSTLFPESTRGPTKPSGSTSVLEFQRDEVIMSQQRFTLSADVSYLCAVPRPAANVPVTLRSAGTDEVVYSTHTDNTGHFSMRGSFEPDAKYGFYVDILGAQYPVPASLDRSFTAKVLAAPCPDPTRPDRLGVLPANRASASVDETPREPGEAPVTAQTAGGTESTTEAPTNTETLQFAFASFAITGEEDRATLARLAGVMRRDARLCAVLLGHTDSTGSRDFNEALSIRRALAAAAALLHAGIDEQRLVTHGCGARGPVATNETAEGRAVNRRVEIEIGAPEVYERASCATDASTAGSGSVGR